MSSTCRSVTWTRTVMQLFRRMTNRSQQSPCRYVLSPLSNCRAKATRAMISLVSKVTQEHAGGKSRRGKGTYMILTPCDWQGRVRSHCVFAAVIAPDHGVACVCARLSWNVGERRNDVIIVIDLTNVALARGGWAATCRPAPAARKTAGCGCFCKSCIAGQQQSAGNNISRAPMQAGVQVAYAPNPPSIGGMATESCVAWAGNQ
jgi:hypothetical protein